MTSLDPRLAMATGVLDPRLVRPAAPPRQVLKALRRRPVPSQPPSAAAVEAERPFWGPHPDPEIAYIEDAFYRPASDFLRHLAGAALGRTAPRTLVKAWQGLEKPVDGWGKLADLFRSDLSPSQLMQGWQAVVDRLVAQLFPPTSRLAVAQGLAVRTSLLFRLGQQVAGGKVPTEWSVASKQLSPTAQEAMAWTRTRGLQYMTRLTDQARAGLLQVLIDSRQAGEGTGALQRRMFDQFSQLNRDWRRIALTETAMAVQNAQLASVDPEEGWEALWMAAANACPYCLAQNGKRFRVVAAAKGNKDSEREVWPSKSNVGRSASRWNRKQARTREKAELWHPCIPAHPCCACRWLLRRAKMRSAA